MRGCNGGGFLANGRGYRVYVGLGGRLSAGIWSTRFLVGGMRRVS